MFADRHASSSRLRSQLRRSIRSNRRFETLESRRLLAAQLVNIVDPFVANETWTDVAEIDEFQFAEASHVRADEVRRYVLNRELLQGQLEDAPLEHTPPRRDATTILLPAPNGELQEFRVFRTSMMAPELAAKFPEIQTFAGQGITDPASSLRLDLSPAGLHAQVLSPEGGYYIDPYYHLSDSLYASYYRAASSNRPEFEFLHDDRVDRGELPDVPLEETPRTASRSGAQLRTYRTAVAATGEYTTFHGGTVPLAQAAIVTAINRVSGIYETELSIRLQLVANNDLLVYTNGATDPYSNDDGGDMLDENQANVDAIIEPANYDIGHVFSTGGGGVAVLGSVGIAGLKAQGVTGLDSPIGDPFFVDYVAHEMGHQFGGDHTWNGDSGACSPGEHSPTTAMEPGSGSTIQGYAGICDDDNLQPRSDPYFHSASFDQIIEHVDNVIPGVGIRTATGNSVPSADAGDDFTIPASTPFMLSGSGTDGDGDVLTYNWEQRDAGPQQDVTAGDTGSNPLFRSFLPSVDPTRTFPQLASLLNNTTVVGETLPTMTRTMNFRLTVRDNRAGGGGVNTDDMVVNVVNTGNPFAVLSPNGGETLSPVSVETVTWDVAGTTGGGIDTANVNILLSTDGGATFPIVLADSVPNDGTHDVVLPDINSSQARIKVEGDGNIFFDISDTPFMIGVPPTLVCAAFESFDSVTVPALPDGWTRDGDFETASDNPDSGPNHVLSTAGPEADDRLNSPLFTLDSTQLRFRNSFDIDDGFHGAVLEISVAGGPFVDIVDAGGSFVSGGYTDTIDSMFGNPLGGRQGWSGFSDGYIDSIVNLPGSAVGQDVEFRWRLGTDNLGASGFGWQVDTIELCGPPPAQFDYGDAPDPTYPTLSTSNGAVHGMGGLLFLGAQVDADDDGEPSPGGDGDDVVDGTDDEDGVTLPASVSPGQSVPITVNSSVAGGLLNAWIDFNRDGDWEDSNEQIFTNQSLAAGDNNGLSFTVPAGATTGSTFARFRLSTQAGISFDGPAIDGEVEDYPLLIGSASPQLSIADAQIIEGHAGTSNLRFNVSLSSPSTETVMVDVSVADDSAKSLAVERVASGLSNPVFATAAPGEPDLLFIVEQTGDIEILNLQTNAINAAPFLTVTGLSAGGERGLLGLAFHPEYETNRLFYVYMTDSTGASQVRRYEANSGGATADPNSATPVLGFPQPAPNHNGGWIGFGPDGYLYVASGDGGGANDLDNNAQDITENLLGKMLRIDVDGDDFPLDPDFNYAIPDDNPFVGASGDDEIWAFGLRNPWRSSFDRLTGDLYIADVGQNFIEEINVQPAASPGGANYGWRLREGTTQTATGGVGGPRPIGAIDPIYEYSHGSGPTQGFSVSGGYVYRGPIPELQGSYFFADYVNERIWSVRYNGDAPSTFDGTNHTDFTDWTDLLRPDAGQIDDISSFGEDAVGNLYIVDRSGELFRISRGADYLEATTKLTFDPGVITQPFDVEILGDRQPEPNETITVTLSAPVNATINDGQAIGTIINDDAPRVESVRINGGDAQRSIVDEVTLTFDSVVEFDESGGSAFVFRNLDSTAVDHVKSVSNLSGKTVVTFNFVTGPSVESRGSKLPTLAKGDYELTVVSSRISVTGIALDGNADGDAGGDYVFVDNFFRRFGDFNGNHIVDLLDFANFRRTFGLSNGDIGYLDAYDANADDAIALLDFAEFRRNFG